MNSSLKETFLKLFGRFRTKKVQIMKNLAIFDFDHTVIDDNSDTAVMKLVEKSKFSAELRSLHKVEGWTAFMQGVFEVLHENNVTESEIAKLIKNIPEVKGMKNLILELHGSLDYDIVIVSDSNTYFIDSWLQENNLSSHVLKVFSNPAEFDQEGLLNIKMFQVQEVCKLSTKNMCKGMIMEDFIKNQRDRGILYKKVLYVGDGNNDLCPILRLNSSSIACCRDKYKCLDLVKKIKAGQDINENDHTKYQLKAQLCVWESGQDILDFLNN